MARTRTVASCIAVIGRHCRLDCGRAHALTTTNLKKPTMMSEILREEWRPHRCTRQASTTVTPVPTLILRAYRMR
jgi:hypothetical protein